MSHLEPVRNARCSHVCLAWLQHR